MFHEIRIYIDWIRSNEMALNAFIFELEIACGAATRTMSLSIQSVHLKVMTLGLWYGYYYCGNACKEFYFNENRPKKLRNTIPKNVYCLLYKYLTIEWLLRISKCSTHFAFHWEEILWADRMRLVYLNFGVHHRIWNGYGGNFNFQTCLFCGICRDHEPIIYPATFSNGEWYLEGIEGRIIHSLAEAMSFRILIKCLKSDEHTIANAIQMVWLLTIVKASIHCDWIPDLK